MEQPTSNGIVFETDDSVDFEELAAAIDDAIGEPDIVTFAQDVPTPIPAIDVSPEEIASLVPEQEDGVQKKHLYVPLEPMNVTEISELIELISAKYSEHGYVNSSGMLEGVLSIPPDGVTEHTSIAKKSFDTTHIIRFGYKLFLSQPPHIWCEGLRIECASCFAKYASKHKWQC